jgi:cell division topological specificity factor
MSFLSFLLGQNKQSASLAKERLQIILAHERSARSPRRPDYLPALQRELLGVVSKYVKVQAKDIQVSFESQRNIEVLEVKIEFPQALRA